jgi:folate-dependent tRNA-U54 methylase TrmFO/GidA
VSSINDYVEKFEELTGKIKRDNPSLQEEYFTHSFISGLKEPIQHHLQCHKPKSLNEACWYARRLEQTNQSSRKFLPFNPAAKLLKPGVKDIKAPDQKEANNIVELRALLGSASNVEKHGFLEMLKFVRQNKIIQS